MLLDPRLFDPRRGSRRPGRAPGERRVRNESEEGAVMLVVMLVVLMVTATAIFASHSTMFELRAAGSQRQAMQTQYVAEGSLVAALAMIDTLGAGSIDLAMQRVPIDAGRQFTAEEPAYGQATPHFRAYMRDFLTMPGVIAPPIESTAYGGSFGGTTLGYQPDFIIDINDSYDPGRPIAGMSATGDSPVAYRIWTVTARGRTGLGSTDTFAPGESSASPLSRGIHEAAMNSRALVISGPIAR